jgi:hypothetical protein
MPNHVHCWHSAKNYDSSFPRHIYVCCKSRKCQQGRQPCGAVIVHPGITYEERSHGLLGPLRKGVEESLKRAREILNA